ncbi:hypothetical protein Y032_0022g587 [Ancylostoma ceylanicum]|nr:hypothetical protein Y032_0022g587 [Ancylostoma ceylanicum]
MLSRSQTLTRCLHAYSLQPSSSSVVPLQSIKRWTTSSPSETVRTAETPSKPRSLSILSASDIVSAAPASVKPYLQLMRLDKPTGSWLLYWPCTWSIALATPAGQLPSLYYLMLFGVGSVLMRGAGCVINDLWDKDFDKRVERTKMRPLACGSLTERQAIYFLSGLLSTSLAVLMQLNWFSVAVGSASMILVVAYPLAKRFTYWPQFVLGKFYIIQLGISRYSSLTLDLQLKCMVTFTSDKCGPDTSCV